MAERTSVQSDLWWKHRPGDRVRTVEGLLGTVTDVADGPVPGSEVYYVTLDADMGGGKWGPSELTAVSQSSGSRQTQADTDARQASESYPELAELLDAPPLPPSINRVAKAATSETGRGGDPAFSEGWASNEDPFSEEHGELPTEDITQPSKIYSYLEHLSMGHTIDESMVESLEVDAASELTPAAQDALTQDTVASVGFPTRRVERREHEGSVPHEAGFMDWVLEPYDNQDPGRAWSYDVCRYRRDSHCFSGDTEFLTYDGYRTFKEVVNTTQRVLDGSGRWVEAEILPFGEQQLYAVTIERWGEQRIIYATAGHRWFVQGQGKDDGFLERLTIGEYAQAGLPEPYAPIPQHPLSEIDEDNKQAVCEVCGPVAISMRHGKWRCRTLVTNASKRSQARKKIGHGKTPGLRIGDRLSVRMPRTQLWQWYPNPTGVAHGIVFGDGTRTTGDDVLRGNSCFIDLWGDKDAQLLRYFDGCRQERRSPDPEQEREIAGTQVTGLPSFFKSEPSLDEAPQYLYGWLAGYFAADGCVAEDGQVTITSADRRNLEIVQAVANRLTICAYDIHEYEGPACDGRDVIHRAAVRRHGSCGACDEGRTRTYYALSFVRQTLNEDFFLIEDHRRRFSIPDTTPPLAWRVVSIEETDRCEEVFCAVVPTTHSFVLQSWMLTGNCWYSKELDAQGTDEAGYSVWVPRDRGPCPRISHDAQRDCELYDPGPRSNDPNAMTDATIPWHAGGQRGGTPKWRRGASKQADLDREAGFLIGPCQACQGLGDDNPADPHRCPTCDGSGRTTTYYADESAEPVTMLAPSPTRMPIPASKIAVGANSTGVMVALPIPDDVGQDLLDTAAGVQDIYGPGDMEDLDNLHITLAYVGNTEDVDRDRLETIVSAYALQSQPLTGHFSGFGVFENNQDKVLVALVDIPGLETWREGLVETLRVSGIDVPSDHGYVPHATLLYGGEANTPQVPSNLPDSARDDFIWDSFLMAYGGDWVYWDMGNHEPVQGEQKAAGLYEARGGIDKAQVCKYCDNDATTAFLWAEGMAYIPACDEHHAKARSVIVDDNNDEVISEKDLPAREASWDAIGFWYDEGYGDQASDGHPDTSYVADVIYPEAGLDGVSEYAYGVAEANGGALPDSMAWSAVGLSEDGTEAREDLGGGSINTVGSSFALMVDDPDAVDKAGAMIRSNGGRDTTIEQESTEGRAVISTSNDMATWYQADGHERLASVPGVSGISFEAAQFRFGGWDDIVDKAKNIRSSGGVKITSATGNWVSAEVQGSTDTYTTTLQLVPGTNQIADWRCGCAWNTYAWGRSPGYTHLEGRKCAHATALQYEVQSQGMFGGEVTEHAAHLARVYPDDLWVKYRGDIRSVTEVDGDDVTLDDGTVVSGVDVDNPRWDAQRGLDYVANAELPYEMVRSQGGNWIHAVVDGRAVCGTTVVGSGEPADARTALTRADCERCLHVLMSHQGAAIDMFDDHFDHQSVVHDEPEPALPHAYGDEEGGDEDDFDISQADSDDQKGSDDDLARRARRFAKESLKSFTPAEQAELIGEAGTASNLSRLDISGTHYEMIDEYDDMDMGAVI